MALADTAKLVVALGLEDRAFKSGLSSANRSLNTFQSGLGQTGRGIGQLGAGVGRVTSNLIKLGVAGASALGGFIGLQLRAGTQSLRELEVAVAQTNAVIASTKGVAGESASAIRNLAEKYEGLNATLDDKVIQSGENLLLTFTNIRKEAFEPALQAALDMNQAMGGGPEGLHDTIIRLGKALQDPVRGFTSLRRVGVNITKDQQDQIKALIAQNDLYGAQQIILKELATEFGGSFARAGDTAAGRMARLKDNVEDLQRSFAGPFSNVLDRATGKLGAFLGETGTVEAVNRFGVAIASLFDDAALDRGISVLRSGLKLLSAENLAKAGRALSGVVDFVKSIDFETIGKGLQITANIAKTAIDAFLSLPPEVQSIAIAALAANRLSGGLIASGLGNVAGGLLRLALGSLKTITAGNVTVIGANVVSPGGGLPGVPVIPAAGAVGGLALSIAAALIAAPTVIALMRQFSGDPNAPGSRVGFRPGEAPSTGGRPISVRDAQTSAALREGLPALKSEFSRSRATSTDLYHLQRSEASRRSAEAAQVLDKLRGQANSLIRIAEKNFSPTVNVRVTTNTSVSVSNVVRTINSYTAAIGSGPGGAVSNPY